MYKSMFEMYTTEDTSTGPRKRKKSCGCPAEGTNCCAIDGTGVCCKEGTNKTYNSDRCFKEGTTRSFFTEGTVLYTKEGKEEVQLLRWDDMPKHLQFNPYVRTGYRPLQSAGECLKSLFYFHNETVNIFTHGVSIVCMAAVLPRLLPWHEARFLSMCHLLGAMAPWCGSFLYHLFMNHARGEWVYQRLLQLDMLGIWVSQSIGAIPMVTATIYCAPAILRCTTLVAYCALSLVGLYKAMRAWSPWERRLCFALPFCMRMLLVAARAARVGGGDPQAFLHVVLQDAVSVFGGVIGALHVPEKWFPGAVDRCLNSHNIMHVLVVLAVYSMHQVTTRDLVWMSHTDCAAH